MNVSLVTEILGNALLGVYVLVGIGLFISTIHSVLQEHRDEMRRQERDKRDLEYHEKRMKELEKR